MTLYLYLFLALALTPGTRTTVSIWSPEGFTSTVIAKMGEGIDPLRPLHSVLPYSWRSSRGFRLGASPQTTAHGRLDDREGRQRWLPEVFSKMTASVRAVQLKRFLVLAEQTGLS